MKIDRRHTLQNHDPYHDIIWDTRDAVVRNDDGSVVQELTGNVVPSSWSKMASDILVTKYFRKAGVPSKTVPVAEEGVPKWLWRSVPSEDATFGRETDARQTFRRLAGCWTYHGWKEKYFTDEVDAQVFMDEMQWILAHQHWAPNSPQWFNSGVFWDYGIKGDEQSYWRVNPKTGEPEQTTSSYEFPSASACFILSVSDNLVEDDGIFDAVLREAKIFKMGGGSGSNFSAIRGKNEPLSGGGYSSGFMSFTKVDDRAAGAIQSGGRVRRASKMKVLNLDHPDIEEFVDWKMIEEQKVAALITGSRLLNKHLNRILQVCSLDGNTDPGTNRGLRRALFEARRDEIHDNYLQRVLLLAKQGIDSIHIPVYTTDWQGEAYNTVSGQNSNNSTGIVDDFMVRVGEDRDWHLYWRTELIKAGKEKRPPAPCKTFPARRLWGKINHASWSSADPGLLFLTRMNEWHTCPYSGPIISTNPCGEFAFLDNTSCNLGTHNYRAYHNPNTNQILVDDLTYDVRLTTITLDITVGMAQYPSREVALQTWRHRTLGLGPGNVGSLLLSMGIPYDSDEGRAVAAGMTALLHFRSYAVSAEIASKLGPFPAHESNREPMRRVIHNHQLAGSGAVAGYENLSIPPYSLKQDLCPVEVWDSVQTEGVRMVEWGKTYGYRNAQTTVAAPAGTIGPLMDFDTTGIEPDYSLVKHKDLAGGGMMRIANQAIRPALTHLGYDSTVVEAVEKHVVGHGEIGTCPIVTSSWWWGFLGPKDRDRVETTVKTTSHVLHALTPKTFGETLTRHFGVSTEDGFSGDHPNLIEALGLTARDITTINNHVHGHGGVEGAAGLRPEHYSIFDCASRPPCGTRFLRPEAHILMVAALQPFIAGSLSKTSNCPDDITIDAISDLHMLAWKTGCKGITVYRDRSKLSAPLSKDSVLLDLGEDETEPKEKVREITRYEVRREKLPWKRPSHTVQVRIGGQSLLLTTGYYADGRLGEITITYCNGDTPFYNMLSVNARLISVMLQHGIPISEITDKLIGVTFEPNGLVQNDPATKIVKSVLDWVGRYLAIYHEGRLDLVQGVINLDEEPPSGAAEVGSSSGGSLGRMLTLRPTSATPEEGLSLPHVFEPVSPLKMTERTDVAAPDPKVMQISTQDTWVTNGEICPACHKATLIRTGTCQRCVNPLCLVSVGGCG